MLIEVQPTTSRSQVIESISKIRKEWQIATNGVNLVEVKGSIGLLLADLVKAVDLNPEEQIIALGTDLYNQINDNLTTPFNEEGTDK